MKRVAGSCRCWASMLLLCTWSCAPHSQIRQIPQIPQAPDAKIDPPPPSTDIFLVDFDTSAVPWRATEVLRLTDRDAYDNQPYFEADGDGLLFTSAQDGQTDIFRYQIGSDETERLTETAESEYSPTPITGWPGFSTVRVEADGAQRLWRFPGSLGAGREPELVFEEIAPVGYHAWIDPETVAMFVLGEPNKLLIGDLLSQESRTVATEIGRALHRVPGKEAVSFVDKTDPEDWSVSIIDIASGEMQRVIGTPSGSEDFVWWSDHEILIGNGSKLYLFDLDASGAWQEIADLSGDGVLGITRLSPSPHGDRLAVVGERTED